MEKNRLLHDNLGSLFIAFVLPTVMAELLAGIQSIIDGMFIGNYVSANAMSSINIASPFIQMIFGCAMVVSTGAVSYLGRVIGQKDYQKAENVFKSALIGLTTMLIIIEICGLIFAKEIALFLGANEALLRDSIIYIRVFMLFAPFVGLMNFFGFVDRILDKPKNYLYATITCLITNIVADYLAVKVLGLGVAGAAFATGLAFFNGCFIVIQPLLDHKSIFNIHKGKFNIQLFKELSINGSSEGIGYLSTAITIFLFNTAFMHFVGEEGIAAFTIVSYIGNFTALIMFGISDGIVSIASCNFGAKQYDRVRKTFYLAAMLNFMFGLICFAILHNFSYEIISIFLKDNPTVVNIAVAGSFYYALSFLFVGFNILQSGFNTAVGNAYSSLLISGCRGIVFNFIGISIFPRILKLTGVWLTFPFAEISTALVCIIIMLLKHKLYFGFKSEKC